MKEQWMKQVLTEDTEVIVYFDVQPEEPRTHDHPGCVLDVTINAVVLHGYTFDDLMPVLSELTLENLRVCCIEALHDGTTNDAPFQKED